MTASAAGLAFASSCAIASVVTDVCQKKSLAGRPLLTTIALIRLCVFFFLTLTAWIRHAMGHRLPWQVLLDPAVAHVPHLHTILILDSLLVAAGILMYNRALRSAPLAYTVPFLTFTPVFILTLSALAFHQRLNLSQFAAAALIVFGSLVLHRSQLQMSWLQPTRALVEQPVSRSMLLVALILASSNLLEQWLVARLDIFTLAWVYALGSSLIFGSVWLGRRSFRSAEPASHRWPILCAAAAADASTLLFQFASLQFLSAVVTLSFKRSGILLTVLAGRVFFREKNVAHHLIAAAIMIGGAIMLYLPFQALQQIAFSTFLFLLGIFGPRALASRESVQP